MAYKSTNKDNKKVTKSSKTEKKTTESLFDRWSAMDADRQSNGGADDWESHRKRALLVKEDTANIADWQSDIHIWIAFGLIETTVATLVEQNPQVDFMHVKSQHKGLEDIYQQAYEYTWERNSFLEWYDHIKDMATYGKAYWYEFYRQEFADHHVPIGFKKDKEGNILDTIDYKKDKVITFDDVYGQNIAIDDIWLDESAKSIETAEDCFIRYTMREDTFKRIFKDYPNSKLVGTGGNMADDSKYNTTFNNPDMIEVYYYYNKVQDKMGIWAGGLLIHETPNPYAHKELPLAESYWVRKTNSKWGTGIMDMTTDPEKEITDYRRMRIDKMKMETGQRYVHSMEEGVDEIDFAEWGVGVSLGLENPQAFTPLPVGNQLSYTYRDEEALKEDIVRQTGVDWRDQGVQQGKISATEVLRLAEATRKRLNLTLQLMNKTTVPRIAKLRLQNINQFWKIPKYRKVIDKKTVDQWDKEFEKFKGENPQYRESDYEQKDNAVYVREKRRFLNKEGRPMWVDPSELSNDMIVRSAGISLPVSRSIEMEQWKYLAEVLSKHPEVDQKKLIETLLDKYNAKHILKDTDMQEDLDRITGSENPVELAEKENILIGEGQFDGIEREGTPGATPEHTALHVAMTENPTFEELDEDIKSFLMSHTKGELQVHRQGQRGGEQELPPQGGYNPLGTQPGETGIPIRGAQAKIEQDSGGMIPRGQ